MIKFVVEHAKNQQIPTHVLLSKPLNWEGRKRVAVSDGLAQYLQALGARFTVVDGEAFDTGELSFQEVFARLDAAVLSEVDRWCGSRDPM